MVPHDSDLFPMTCSVFSVSHVSQDSMCVQGHCAGQDVRMLHIDCVTRKGFSIRKVVENTYGTAAGAGLI